MQSQPVDFSVVFWGACRTPQKPGRGTGLSAVLLAALRGAAPIPCAKFLCCQNNASGEQISFSGQADPYLSHHAFRVHSPLSP